jgi:exosome complex RNA-binding protein Csl4
MKTGILRHVTTLAAAVTIAGCGGNTLGALGDVLGGVLGMPAGAGGGQGQIAAEIRSVDTQQRVIQVATQDGQTGGVRYDQNTVVVYQQQQYPVTALERGDLVVLHVQDVQGTLYTQRIDVQQSVQQRGGTGSGAVAQLAGRISQIDQNSGAMVVQAQTGNVTVSLPLNAPQATVDYFRRLRVGDNVRLEVTQSATGRVEIHRFL